MSLIRVEWGNFAKVFSTTEKIAIFAVHFANSYLAIYIRS